jgi:small subunit ribosomal protein S2
MKKQLSLMDLYKIGAHRGNHKSRVNPKLKKYIHEFDSKSLAVIDLPKTIQQIEKIAEFFYKLGSRKKQIFIVGTSKYLKEQVPALASKIKGSPTPYVNSRWLGGTATNWSTVKKTLKTLEKLEDIIKNEKFFDKLSRNEQLQVTREYNKKEVLFGGLKHLKSNRPGAILVLDAQKNYTTIIEAQTINVPVVVFGNTNTQVLPKNMDNFVLFNNASLEAVQFISGILIDSYNEGLENALIAKEETKLAERNNTEKKNLERIKN